MAAWVNGVTVSGCTIAATNGYNDLRLHTYFRLRHPSSTETIGDNIVSTSSTDNSYATEGSFYPF